MKLFIAGLDTETNTFSPIPTGLKSFEDCLLAHGDATSRPLTHCSAQLAVWRRLGEARGCTVIESLCAVAEPAGIVNQTVYESFREEILRDLRASAPVDFVLLALHGAMVAYGYDDVEGDLLEHVRALVGPHIPVGAELDLHCHLTAQMVRNATALVLFKEYPHTDIEERAAELFQIMLDAAQRRTQPVMAIFDCHMIGSFRTQEQPLRAFVDRMKGLEGRDDVLSISFSHGFPWGDVADVGAKTLVITDGTGAKAEALASALGREIYEMRQQLVPRCLSIDQALDLASASVRRPVVLADIADNAGGGAPGDATFILERILKRGIRNVVSALHWDPIAVRFCQEAGQGATLDLRIGGKAGPSSGPPIDLRVTVRRIGFEVTQRFGTISSPVGDAAWVSTEGLDIVLNTRRTQVFHPECMTSLGLDLSSRDIVIVKSTNHFYAGFASMAGEIHFVDAPGALHRCFDQISYQKVNRPLWPMSYDPLGVGG
jgi:microcystin degradation protein MlrC